MARGKKAPDPVRTELGQVVSKRDKLTYFEVPEALEIGPDEYFNIFPGPKGKGWVLTVVKKDDLEITP